MTAAPGKARKIAAALAAVQMYLQEEQARTACGPPALERPGLSAWGLSGRFAAVGARMGSRGAWRIR